MQDAMVEQVETKSAFINKKYSNEDKLKREEEELEQLMAEQKGEVKQEEPEPENAEEKSFKKRYGDLRRHQQEKEKELSAKIEALQAQLSEATKKEINLPKSDEDIEAWAAKYPDVAAIVETIAIKKAKEQAAVLEERVKAVDELQMTATREKAEAELLRYHPDFEDIRETDDFHNWVNEQPQSIQDALYENASDARTAARAIDLYKADKNITTKKKTKTTDKDAARSVNARNSRSKPDTSDGSKSILESDVQKMSAQEYEKMSDEIMEAIRTGNFVYDLSGNAR
jgi:hypothetical protein|tara:strand:- start:243 stop:1097 length:855 start_codon:yes stop_codon:yes gene_type:complete